MKYTQYGFEWGPVDVSRCISDEKEGWVLLLVKTKKFQNPMRVYVTKTGKIRIFSDSGEWQPPP